MIRYFLLGLLFPLGAVLAQPQKPSYDQKVLDEYLKYNERISLRTNSSFLLVGETLLFTIHCFNDNTNAASDLSSVAYVELISEDARPILQTKVALENGRGSGDFYLPSLLRTGNYTLIAYTNWMKNFPIGDFFQTTITIINPFKKPFPRIPDKEEIPVSLFPEGGNLIAGHLTTIGYFFTEKVKNEITSFSITIVDNHGNKVIQLAPSADGKGTFSITPLPDQEYTAIIAGPNSFHLIKLPEVKKEGIGIHLKRSGDQFKLNVRHRGTKETSKATLNVHHHSGKLIYTSTILFENDSVSINIPVQNFPQGVSRFTVVNVNGRIECERKVFVKSNTLNALEIRMQKNNFRPRERVPLDVILPDSLDQAYVCLSARIVDKEIAKHNPTKEVNPVQSDESIDIEMLITTQRTDKSNQELKIGEKRVYLPEIRGMLISGTATDQGGTPLNNEPIYLSVPARDYLFMASKTDSSGNFYFNTKKLKYDTDILFQVPPHHQNNYQLHIEDTYISNYEKFVPTPLLLDSSLSELIKKRSVWIQIENSYYNEKRDSILSDKEHIKFYGTPDIIYLLDNYVRFPSLDDVLIEYIPEISLRKKGDQYSIKVVNFKNGVAFEEDPLILLDGVPLFDHNQVIELNPLQIKKIEIIKRKYFYGPLELSGIISLETYAGDAFKMANKNITTKTMTGLQAAKNYYQPDYAHKDLERIPDFRLQLYWNPSMVITNPVTSLEFYASDVEGDFEIIVDGFDSKGNRFFDREVFTVSQP